MRPSPTSRKSAARRSATAFGAPLLSAARPVVRAPARATNRPVEITVLR
ncbi:MAG: hypothetical protein JNL38_03185 [Myxococcales bacterium]|nr:hypothetical protein [Myxococcales bacterium]